MSLGCQEDVRGFRQLTFHNRIVAIGAEGGGQHHGTGQSMWNVAVNAECGGHAMRHSQPTIGEGDPRQKCRLGQRFARGPFAAGGMRELHFTSPKPAGAVRIVFLGMIALLLTRLVVSLTT